MQKFEVLFDRGEPSPIEDPAYERYGQLGFPPPPEDRPWIYSNFVQTLDGIVSFRGEFAAASNISQSAEDRWLMDLLRANADGVLLGVNTLVEETLVHGAEKRGPVFRIVDPELQEVRQKLGKAKEKNIFVTGSGNIDLANFRAFDGERADPILVTTSSGEMRLKNRDSHPQVKVIVAGESSVVDLVAMVRILQAEYGIRYLLCEGGPHLYGNMARAGLVDEKFLTVSPIEVGQLVPPEQPLAEWENPLDHFRPTTFGGPGFTMEKASHWRWISSRRVGEHEFNRYRRRR